MKLRYDFVSNSSSSSYIVAIDFGKYDFKLFVDNVCKTCSDGSDDIDVMLENESVLRNGMYHECLYLGNPVIGKKSERWRRFETWHHTFLSPEDSAVFYTPFEEYTSSCYISRPDEKIKRIDENTIIREYNNVLPGWKSVPYSIMSELLKKPYDYGKSERYTAKNGVDRIIRYAKRYFKPETEYNTQDVFLITLNTIRNTRNIIKAGLMPGNYVEDRFSALDEIEFRLKYGETFIYAITYDCDMFRRYGALLMPDGYGNPFFSTPAENVKELFKVFF